MKSLNLFNLAFKQLHRHRMRSLLTILGVATGMFLYMTVENVQAGMKAATEISAGDDTLVVYRDKRFCPFTSRLPEDYTRRIKAIDGVKSVTPIKVVVNNCATSLDVVTFRGIPASSISVNDHSFHILSGDLSQWGRRKDGALVGSALAQRRGLKVGETFDAAGITVQVLAIIDSDNAQDQNAAYVPLQFLQLSSRTGLGIVTQFNVKVNDHTKLKSVASEIDNTFQQAQEPTHTRPEKAFVAQTAGDLIELISFTRYIGLAAVIAVIALVANTVLLSIRGRVKENAVLQTLGFGTTSIMQLIVYEGVLLGFIGGIVGIVSSDLLLRFGSFSLSGEGISINFTSNTELALQAIAISLAIGILSTLWPAWKVSRDPIVESLR